MVNTEIRLTIFFAAEDGETLYSQQNKTWKESESYFQAIVCVSLILEIPYCRSVWAVCPVPFPLSLI